MGKRVPVEEKPFNPVEQALVRSVLEDLPQKDQEETVQESTAKVRQEAGPGKVVSLPPQPQANRQSISNVPTLEKRTREKRMLLTETEEEEIEQLISEIGRELKTNLTLSHVLRACLFTVDHARSEIKKEARKSAPLKRPPNGDLVGLSRFERSLAQILMAAFHDSRPIH